MVYRETVHGKYIPKVYGIIITYNVQHAGSKVAKHKYIESVLKRVEDFMEVKFQRIAPGIYVTDRKYGVTKLKRALEYIEEELPGVICFLAKKPSVRVKDVEEEEVIPAELAPKHEEKLREKRVEIEWEGKVTAQHNTWYISVPKDVKEQLLRLGVQRGSVVRVRFIAKVR